MAAATVSSVPSGSSKIWPPIREQGVFIVDDVAFIQDRHGFAIGEAMAKKGIKKEYLPRDARRRAVAQQGGVPVLEEARPRPTCSSASRRSTRRGSKKFRKRIPLGRNFEALEFARSLGIHVAINIIADPDWDEERFAAIREWCMAVPEIVNISINTPYPGTESWLTEQRRLSSDDYRLFDIQHAVMPTKLPLPDFYRELINTQQVLYAKHLNWRTAPGLARTIAGHLARGQTNFVRGIMQYNKVYDARTLLADHAKPVAYRMRRPAETTPEIAKAAKGKLYVHTPRGRAGRHVDDAVEQFVDATRMGAAP